VSRFLLSIVAFALLVIGHHVWYQAHDLPAQEKSSQLVDTISSQPADKPESGPAKLREVISEPEPVDKDAQALRESCHYWHERYQDRRPVDLTIKELQKMDFCQAIGDWH
jgi:hypothetical protein